MAVTKITWENKTGIQNDESVLRKNKVTDADMNEIKEVVNNNANELTTAKDDIEALQSGQGTASADITSLKNRVSTLETDNTKNKSDINTLKSDNQTNKSNISTIKGQISDIQQEQQTQNTDIENLQTNDNKQDSLISKLKNALINVETEEAKSIHVEDASTIGQLEVLGNHEQETREGYNILPNNLANTTINGVTFTINEDKSVTVKGTATASIIANLITGEYNDNNATEPLIIPDNITNCRLSGCPSGGSSSTYKLDIYNQKYALLATDWGEGTNVTIDSQEDKKIARVRIIIYSGATVNNLTFKPMLVAGTEEKTYEQYGASPSPNYPSEVKCLGSNKNIYDGSTSAINQRLSTGTGATYVQTGYSVTGYIEILPNKYLIINTDYDSYYCFYNAEKQYISGGSFKNTKRIKNSSNAKYIKFDFKTEDKEKIKLEYGSQPTSYSPPGQGSTKISKINKNTYDIAKYPFTNRIAYNSSGGQLFWDGYCGILDYFPVKSNTQYTFSNNLNKPILYGLVFYDKDKQFISATTSSTITFTTPEKCEYIRFAIQSDVLPSWVQIEMGNTATSYIEHKQTDYLLYIQQEMLKGDCFVKEDSWKEVHNWTKVDSCNGETITTEYISTTAELTTGATIYYKLAEIVKINCTEEQSAVLEELNNLDLFEGVNNIITAEDIALLKLKYALDVETYVDNKIDEKLANINAQILEIAGGN